MLNFQRNLKRVVLPGIDLKELSSVSSMLTPLHFILPMFFISSIAQLVDSLKGILSLKEIQQLYSLKVFSRCLSYGYTTLSFSVIQSIAKTLGADLEIISVLSSNERLAYLKSLEKKILSLKASGKIFPNYTTNFNYLTLLKHRKGLALQLRSVMNSVPIFSPYSLVIGLSVKDISLVNIFESSAFLWTLINLDQEEFNFQVRREYFNTLNKLDYFPEKNTLLSSDNCLRLLVLQEMKSVLNFSSVLDFSEDSIVLRSEDNLNLLEREIKFIKRVIFPFSNGSIISLKKFSDSILLSAINQRKFYKQKIERLLTGIRVREKN